MEENHRVQQAIDWEATEWAPEYLPGAVNVEKDFFHLCQEENAAITHFKTQMNEGRTLSYDWPMLGVSQSHPRRSKRSVKRTKERLCGNRAD